MPDATEVLAIIKLVQDLEAPAIGLVKTLLDRLKGATPDQIAAMTHALNATAVQEIDAELGTK